MKPAGGPRASGSKRPAATTPKRPPPPPDPPPRAIPVHGDAVRHGKAEVPRQHRRDAPDRGVVGGQQPRVGGWDEVSGPQIDGNDRTRTLTTTQAKCQENRKNEGP